MASSREERFSSFAEYQRKRQCQHDVSNLDRVLSSKRLKGGLRSSQSSDCSTPQPAKLVTMSRIDKASTVHLSDCQTKVTSRKGYRLVLQFFQKDVRTCDQGQGNTWSVRGMLVLRGQGGVFGTQWPLQNRVGYKTGSLACSSNPLFDEPTLRVQVGGL